MHYTFFFFPSIRTMFLKTRLLLQIKNEISLSTIHSPSYLLRVFTSEIVCNVIHYHYCYLCYLKTKNTMLLFLLKIQQYVLHHNYAFISIYSLYHWIISLFKKSTLITGMLLLLYDPTLARQGIQYMGTRSILYACCCSLFMCQNSWNTKTVIKMQ